MFNQPASISRQLSRYLLATPLMLALLGGSVAHAQIVPKPAPDEQPVPSNIDYYVDGQKTDKAVLTKMDPNTISYMQILKGAQQKQIFGTTTADGTAVITTKANANSPAVLALSKRIGAAAPMKPATPEQQAGIAAAQAYVAKSFPNAKLESVFPLPGQPSRFKATFMEAGNRVYLLFDGNGQAVEQ